VTRGKLDTFDFSLTGAEHVGGIERKELGDFISWITSERERAERALMRMLGYQFRAIIVECSWQDIERGQWRSKVSVESVIGTVLGWQAMGVPILFPGSREAAQKCAAKMLFIVARRQWRLARALLGGCLEAERTAPKLMELERTGG